MDKEDIRKFTKKEIAEFMETTLSYCEVGCAGVGWKALRSKILRAGNDCMRRIDSKFEQEQDENGFFKLIKKFKGGK